MGHLDTVGKNSIHLLSRDQGWMVVSRPKEDGHEKVSCSPERSRSIIPDIADSRCQTHDRTLSNFKAMQSYAKEGINLANDPTQLLSF